MGNLKRHVVPFLGALAIAIVTLGLACASQASAASGPDERASAGLGAFGPGSGLHPLALNVSAAAGQQIYRGDLTVESGQTIEGDVVLYDGDVVVEDGGAIGGGLVVYVGDIEIDEGGDVAGDVSAFSGDVYVAGSVGGRIVSWSGDVELDSTAEVAGDVSVVSGEIDQEEGANVGGNVVEGPHLQLPPIPPMGRFPFNVLPSLPNQISGVDIEAPSLWQRMFGFFLRVIWAALMTIVATLLVGLVVVVKPALVITVKETMVEQTAFSFAAGLLANLSLLFLAGLLTITLCLAPIALAPILALAALNVVGWAAISHSVGQRMGEFVKLSLQPLTSVIVGALVLTGFTGFFWALGGCFSFLAYVTVFLIASLGTGAVITPWLKSAAHRQPIAASAASEGTTDLTTVEVPPPTVMSDE